MRTKVPRIIARYTARRITRIIALFVLILGFLSPVSGGTNPGLQDCNGSGGSTSCGG